jgi:Xaa-Pro dipeptidase
MTLTVEPGCYFINHLIDEAIKEGSTFKEFLNVRLLNEFRNFGGVRLEDVVAITEDSCENFTVCPRTVAEVEHVMNGGKWPPLKDDDVALKRTRLTECGPMPFSMPI